MRTVTEEVEAVKVADPVKVWRAFPCPALECGSPIFTGEPVGAEIVCPSCRVRVFVQRLGELLQEEYE